MPWQFNRANLLFGLVAWLGILQFAVSVYHAMTIYPDGYSITGNFLSDLGRMETHNGNDNSVCASLFDRSVIVLGISLIPFFAVMPSVLQQGRSVLRVSGVLSAIGLIGIGLTPYDRYFFAHHVALGLWIGPMLVTVVTFFVCAKQDGMSSLMLSTATFFVVLAVIAYAFAGSHDAHVVFQKVLAVLAGCWFILIFITVSVSTIRTISSRRLFVEQQARQYLKVLQRRHGRRYDPNTRGVKAKRRQI